MSAKNAEIRHRVLSKLENELDLTLQKLAEDCQRIKSVRKDFKNTEESAVAYVGKVKYRSQSYSPIKERKKHDYSKKYDYPKFQYRQTSDNQKKKKKNENTQRLLPLWKITLGQGLSLSYKKKCQNCDKFGHKGSQCRNRKIIKNWVRHTKSEDESDKVVRKYRTVKVLNKLVKYQLDSGSDLSIINLLTWRKLNRSIIKMTSKTARTITGDKIKFWRRNNYPSITKSYNKKKKNEKSSYWRIYLAKTGFRNQISGISQKVECITAQAEKIKMELKDSFPEVISAGLGKCTKIKAKFELKENKRSIFRKKQNVPFAGTERKSRARPISEYGHIIESGIQR